VLSLTGYDGKYRAGTGFTSALAYTDFTYRFVEFITKEDIKRISE